MKTAMQNPEMQKVASMIKDIKFTMLTSIGGDGVLRSRPMTTQEPEMDGSIWFFTSEPTEKTSEIANKPLVNLAYSDVSKQTYVSISGIASMNHDKRKMEELWKPSLKAWFPNGLDDPNMALIKVEITEVEYWDTKDSRMVQLYKIAKAALTGTTGQQELDTDHKQIKVV